MQHIQNQENCMYNLMISEIFRIKQVPQNYMAKPLEPQLEDESQKMINLQFYNGQFQADPQSLYEVVRNLYSLSLRQEILILIANITNYQAYLKHKEEHDP